MMAYVGGGVAWICELLSWFMVVGRGIEEWVGLRTRITCPSLLLLLQLLQWENFFHGSRVCNWRRRNLVGGKEVFVFKALKTKCCMRSLKERKGKRNAYTNRDLNFPCTFIFLFFFPKNLCLFVLSYFCFFFQKNYVYFNMIKYKIGQGSIDHFAFY